METETKETPVKGALIYQPQGAASEYAKWAINLYHGCSNGCTYCYNRRGGATSSAISRHWQHLS